MLSNFKKKFFKNLSIFPFPQQLYHGPDVASVNLDAGSDILSYFQDIWHSLHTASESNARLADGTAQDLQVMCKVLSLASRNISMVNTILCEQQLADKIDKCNSDINRIREMCEELEKKFELLELLLDQDNWRKLKINQRYNLQKHSENRLDRYNSIEKNLRKDYEEKLQAFNNYHSKTLLERQHVFQEAFERDLNVFRTQGSLPKVIVSGSATTSSLEDINLDLDDTDLKIFFDDEILS